MTTLAIVANHEKKRLSLTGTVAAGEHVAVTLEDGWAWANAAGAALRLRVVFAGKLIAEFPRRDADPADTWSASGDDATCELNINSVPAAKHLKFGGDCIWVLDDPQLNTLYGVGELEVLPWRREPGGDVPYNLDGYPDLLDEFVEVKDAVSEFDTKKINKSAFISLLGKTLPETATQKEVREMVHDILELLKNAAVCAALAFALPAFAIGTDTAWEDVPPQSKVRDIVEQFSPPADFSTNNAELVETIEAKVPEIQVDFSTNNAALVATIEAKAPAPGNYAAVSNAAMNAISRAEVEAGFTEWVVTPPTYEGLKVVPVWRGTGYDYWDLVKEGTDDAITFPDTISGPNATELRFIDTPAFTATRTRLPTMEDLAAKASTNDVQLTPVYSQTPTFSEWTFSPPAYIDLQYSGDLTIGWIASGSDWSDYVEVGGAQDSTSLAFTGLDGIAYTATRERTDDVIGYTLGSQTNKVLASTNGLARASDVADARAVADAAASTNATQGAALSQLSQRTNDWNAAAQNASDALAYSRATYDFQQRNTNAWFSGTNYVFGADATNKTAFAFEPGMDLAIMPCSLALMELRDGTTQKVWDQRDWTVWYWNFKNAQQEASIAARFAAAAEFNATNYAPIAWGRRTSSGLANPDQKTLWVDAEKTVLAPGMAWESTVEVSGCAYWTIVGSATLSGTTNGVITIKDFEGKPVFSIKKTSSRLAYLECGSEIYTHGSDSQGRITFTMRASVHPVGVFSTVPDDSLFVEETNAGCPVDYEWETLEQPSANSPGVYRIHFLLKPGISSDACFAKFKVEVQGETAVEFTAVQKITGGQVYNDGTHGDVKIRPVITSTAVGSVVTWEVAP